MPLINLLFMQGNRGGFSFTAQQADPRYMVTSLVDDDENLQITVTKSGTQQPLTNTNYILSSLINSGVAAQRNAILSDLTANGFSTYAAADVTLKAMGTTESLTDWPMVGLLGQTINA
jgi:hypothetical protein